MWFKTHCFGFSFEKKEMNLIIMPKSLGSACIPNPLALGLTLDPIVLGQVLLQDLENLDLPPATPKQLGSGMPFQTQVNNNKNYWFYPSNHIYVFL